MCVYATIESTDRRYGGALDHLDRNKGEGAEEGRGRGKRLCSNGDDRISARVSFVDAGLQVGELRKATKSGSCRGYSRGKRADRDSERASEAQARKKKQKKEALQLADGRGRRCFTQGEEETRRASG